MNVLDHQRRMVAIVLVGVLKGHVANIQWRESIIQTKRVIKKGKPCFALQTLSFRDFRRELALSHWAIEWSFQNAWNVLNNISHLKDHFPKGVKINKIEKTTTWFLTNHAQSPTTHISRPGSSWAIALQKGKHPICGIAEASCYRKVGGACFKFENTRYDYLNNNYPL